MHQKGHRSYGKLHKHTYISFSPDVLCRVDGMHLFEWGRDIRLFSIQDGTRRGPSTLVADLGIGVDPFLGGWVCMPTCPVCGLP